MVRWVKPFVLIAKSLFVDFKQALPVRFLLFKKRVANMDLNTELCTGLCVKHAMGITSLNFHNLKSYDHYLYCTGVKTETKRGYISDSRSGSEKMVEPGLHFK